MRLTALVFASLAIIISGCRDKSGVRGYWYSHTPDISDYASAEAVFTDFVEQAVQAPKADAFAAVDLLLRKAGEDGVTYRVYADLIARGFGTIASPCYSCKIFVHAADNILDRGILDGFSLEEYRLRREFCLHNRVTGIRPASCQTAGQFSWSWTRIALRAGSLCRDSPLPDGIQLGGSPCATGADLSRMMMAGCASVSSPTSR